MKPLWFCFLLAACLSAQGVTNKDAAFYSEGVLCHGKLFLPSGFTASGKIAGVVLAPGWGETAASIENYAARFAERGLAAMAIDYRGWGRSGGYLYLAEPIKVDDRQRFSQHTARVLIRRKRLIPRDQVLDIRNAVSYLEGEPGVDRARVGVWGIGMAGGHAIVVAGTDSRVRVVVAQTPLLEGQNDPQHAIVPPDHPTVELARNGQAPTTPAAALARNAEESKLALAEYHPYWYLDQVPEKCAVLFVASDKDVVTREAAKLLKGPVSVTTFNGKAFDTASEAAAKWFLEHL